MKIPSVKIPRFKAQPVIAFRPSGTGIPRGTRGVPKAVRMEGRRDRMLFKDLNHTNVANPQSHAQKLRNS